MSNVHFCVLAPNKWLAHLRTANHDNFSVSCCFDDCSHIKPFTTFSGLKCHIYRTHYQEKVSNGGASETDDEEVNFVPYHEENEYVNTSHYQMAEADLTRLLQAEQKQAAALFIMRLHEISRLSQSAIDDVISGSRSLFNSTLIRLHAGIHQRLAEAGCAEVDIDDIFDEFQNPYTTLDTAYLQEKYINKEFNVLVRVQFSISNLKKLCITGAATNNNRGTLLH